MTVNPINGFILLPHPANWGQQKPSIKRVWDTEVSQALPGGETRQALRAVPRRQLTCTVTATTLQERVRLESRIDAAKKSGSACMPLFGRGSCLTAPAAAGANSVTQNGAGWSWQAGDYIALLISDQIFDMALVNNVAGGVLTLATNLGFAWPAQSLCWPVIFGQFSADKAPVFSGHHDHWKITITELTSARSVQIGVVPGALPGVGKQVIGKTNRL